MRPGEAKAAPSRLVSRARWLVWAEEAVRAAVRLPADERVDLVVLDASLYEAARDIVPPLD